MAATFYSQVVYNTKEQWVGEKRMNVKELWSAKLKFFYINVDVMELNAGQLSRY